MRFYCAGPCRAREGHGRASGVRARRLPPCRDGRHFPGMPRGRQDGTLGCPRGFAVRIARSTGIDSSWSLCACRPQVPPARHCQPLRVMARSDACGSTGGCPDCRRFVRGRLAQTIAAIGPAGGMLMRAGEGSGTRDWAAGTMVPPRANPVCVPDALCYFCSGREAGSAGPTGGSCCGPASGAGSPARAERRRCFSSWRATLLCSFCFFAKR